MTQHSKQLDSKIQILNNNEEFKALNKSKTVADKRRVSTKFNKSGTVNGARRGSMTSSRINEFGKSTAGFEMGQGRAQGSHYASIR